MAGLKILAGMAALLCSTSAMAQTGGWKITEASGRVIVRDAGGERPVARGAAVPAGSTLSTGPGARAVMVRGEDFVTVSANSRMRVPDAAQATGLLQMIGEWGSAVFRIKKQAKPHFGVQTPYLAAVVKGTTFSVTVGAEGASLQVVEGLVEVATSDGGARDLVRPGVVASVTAADRHRLSVQGQDKRVIDSPARGASTAPTAAPVEEPATATLPAGGDDMAVASTANSVVEGPIEARPVDLATVTGGLVSGKAAGVMVAALMSPPAPSPTPDVPVVATPAPAGPAAPAEGVAAAPPPPTTPATGPSPAAPAEDVAAAPPPAAPALDAKPAEPPVEAKPAADGGTPEAKPEAAAPKDEAGDKAGGKDSEKPDAKPEPSSPKDDKAEGKDDKSEKPDAKGDDTDAKPEPSAPKDDKPETKDATKDKDDPSHAKDAADAAAKAAEKAAKDAEDAAKDRADALKKAADDAAKDAEKAAKDDKDAADAKKAADKAAQEADALKKETDQAAKDAADADKSRLDALKKAAEDAAKDAEKAAKDATKDAEKAAKDAEKAAKDAAKDLEDAAKDLTRGEGKDAGDTKATDPDVSKGKKGPGKGFVDGLLRP